MNNNRGTASPHPCWLAADWPAPPHIKAGTTTRQAGISARPYDCFNLAAHVGDAPRAVLHNRALLKELLALPDEPVWLRQTHGNRVAKLTGASQDIHADGAYTDKPSIICAVLTADCIPLLLCNRSGTEIAAIHVGWRGFGAGILAAALARFHCAAGELLAWTGPHISKEHYEVGEEVRQACLAINNQTKAAFSCKGSGRWLADLALLLRIGLEEGGVKRIYSSGRCTYRDEESLFSYRRDKATGRMASLIWMDTWN